MKKLLNGIARYLRREGVWMDRALGITSADPYRVVSEPGYESGGLRRKLLDPAVCLDGPSPVAYRRELREVTKRYELERRRI